MKVIFCKPKLSMNNTECADRFFRFCREVLDTYVAEAEYISTAFQVDQRLAAETEANDIFIFFNNENGNYEEKFLKLVEKYISAQSRVWAIAMEKIRHAGVRRSRFLTGRALMYHAEMKTGTHPKII